MSLSATVTVQSQSPYTVIIGHDLKSGIIDCVAAHSPSQVAIITQPAVAAYAHTLADAATDAGITPTVFEVPDAEAGKTLSVCEDLWNALGQKAFGRTDMVIGLGGGAATDLAGFVAAAWMRGIKVVQVPTTLLAMVDAAVGGKTGINTQAGKNLVGAFHEPTGVFIDLDFLPSLPQAELVAGSAEIIKTGFISDTRILELYETDAKACLKVDGFLPELIRRSVTVKARVVGQDLKESGLRETLNYGHTFGHAVELAENFTWRHGNAVAVGMMFIAHLSHIVGLIDDQLVARHAKILRSIGLPTSYSGHDFDTLYQGMTRDKKNRDGKIRFVALTAAGETTRLENATYEQLLQAYERVSVTEEPS
ncbi:3-dehydroquinate synthase [Corynebacterium felinum]|uniref:3-dehydroquinate synthase n=1 Tax=Corynebacterium felinum TaxID=131318 RepID=A0ABU2BAY8_9CORY|nr:MULTISPECIES: 3-dehydroquinate synthase [Corynebacterium]MDF5821938.1 3-dehydroquinate synthase [Corynebacterium felinum]MDO4760342.1 3-dehydroquinate synthase [Corynebacterium sp.]MDR7355770.1 3-dehydroquinate synthase [Corynebacterium felinum]WJY95116.1 3-dehydroquinate synthase [Corynebacterium felinum]